MPKSKQSLEPLPPEERAQIGVWLSQNATRIPSAVRIALEQHDAVCAACAASHQKRTAIVRELQRALGITPSSEKRSNGNPLGPFSGGDGKRPRSEAEKLQTDLERLERLSKWHQDIHDRHQQKMDKIKEKLRDLPPVEEIQLSDEQRASGERKTKEMFERMKQGDGPDPALQSVHETLIPGTQIETTEEEIEIPVKGPPIEGSTVVDSFREQRVRYDLRIETSRVVVDVEKKIVIDKNGERHVQSASTEEIGPPGFAVTWRFIANVVIMVAQYAMPMNRIGTLLSSPAKKFTAAAVSRMLRYTAERFFPIYMCLFDELSDASVLSGDDTSPRVLEVQRYFNQPEPRDDPPWKRYRTSEAAMSTASDPDDIDLEVLLSRELGFEFERRDGRGGKIAMHTTAISGRSNQSDPRSLIVFYRSHLGGLGNLLEVLLHRRNPTITSIAIQSDLSTVNLIRDAKLLARFAITHAGCAGHARRPFSIHEDDDPDRCAYMLHLFKGLMIHERGLDLHGRNEQNVTEVRDVNSRETWQEIKQLAIDMTEQWPPDSSLGNGARYIIRHFDKLTAYLNDPRLPMTNNFSERVLRPEKLIESGSMFRTSIVGRFVLDILRTILQTAVAAHVPAHEYIKSVLRTSPAEIKASPEKYTPRAWARANGYE